jgi:hypothetical protein
MMGYCGPFRGFESGSVFEGGLNLAFWVLRRCVRKMVNRLMGYIWSSLRVAFVVLFISPLLLIFC